MPTLDIDGRGKTVQDAVKDLWSRIEPLQERGYHPVTSVEVVDTKTKKVVENYQLTDSEFIAHVESEGTKRTRRKTEEHKPPRPHESRYVARLRLES